MFQARVRIIQWNAATLVPDDKLCSSVVELAAARLVTGLNLVALIWCNTECCITSKQEKQKNAYDHLKKTFSNTNYWILSLEKLTGGRKRLKIEYSIYFFQKGRALTIRVILWGLKTPKEVKLPCYPKCVCLHMTVTIYTKFRLKYSFFKKNEHRGALTIRVKYFGVKNSWRGKTPLLS